MDPYTLPVFVMCEHCDQPCEMQRCHLGHSTNRYYYLCRQCRQDISIVTANVDPRNPRFFFADGSSASSAYDLSRANANAHSNNDGYDYDGYEDNYGYDDGGDELPGLDELRAQAMYAPPPHLHHPIAHYIEPIIHVYNPLHDHGPTMFSDYVPAGNQLAPNVPSDDLSFEDSVFLARRGDSPNETATAYSPRLRATLEHAEMVDFLRETIDHLAPVAPEGTAQHTTPPRSDASSPAPSSASSCTVGRSSVSPDDNNDATITNRDHGNNGANGRASANDLWDLDIPAVAYTTRGEALLMGEEFIVPTAAQAHREAGRRTGPARILSRHEILDLMNRHTFLEIDEDVDEADLTMSGIR